MYYAILYLTLPEEDSITNRTIIKGILAEFKKKGFIVMKIIMNYETKGDYVRFIETLRYAKRKRVSFVLTFYREMIHPNIKNVFSLITEAECLDIIIISFIDGELVNIKNKYLLVEDTGIGELGND